MPESVPETLSPVDWRKLHAFGLPGGSIRAFMAILIFGTLWGHLLLRPERKVPESLNDLLFIILGHYFAVRGRSQPGQDPGPPPLFLPRGAVRLILVSGFLAVAVVLYRHHRLLDLRGNPGVITLLLVAGFLLGVVVQVVARWWSGEARRPPRMFEDIRATISVVATIALAILIWDQAYAFLPIPSRELLKPFHFGLGPDGPEHILAAVVGFYFGSRS